MALLTMFFITSELQAQQDPYFTHYAFNKLQYNPATAGVTGRWCASGLFHTQWTNLEDQTFEFQSGAAQKKAETGVGPKTSGVTFSMPVYTGKKYGAGLGLAIFNDVIGYENNMKARLSLAGRRIYADESSISIGFELGMLQKNLDGTKLIAKDPGDPNIPNKSVGESLFNFGAGLYYTDPNWDNFYVGVSSTNINETQYNYSAGGSGIQVTTARHYYLLAGKEFHGLLPNPNMVFQPSALIKYNSKVQVDLTGLVEYMELYSAGIAYRTEIDAVSILLGYRHNKDLRIGYSYDITLQSLARVSGGTHEFNLNYCFDLELNTERPIYIELTPRFLDKDPTID
jgi:type IX secretion system PorP/SprF family membrane protein